MKHTATDSNGKTVSRKSKHAYTHVVVVNRTAESIAQCLTNIEEDRAGGQCSEKGLAYRLETVTSPKVCGWSSRLELAEKVAVDARLEWAGRGIVEILTCA